MNILLSVFLPLPDEKPLRNTPLNLPDGTTVGQVMDQFGVSDHRVWLYVVNHREIRKREDTLDEGDHLMVFPPMEGG
ncbi:MoaD/ThiS family protein [Anoxynatronum buryatiense]|uniref:ThiS family protein n=1 Tax=Anoxynatronum buryatiense TaxID=489973 RepID=A0AA45WY87_9CLOT|nr:MoaD/ThiS family protein [Anoxynatronum buryatiense]SMP67932.1 ThiS family protein [Anoxynatronum buryatiense]